MTRAPRTPEPLQTPRVLDLREASAAHDLSPSLWASWCEAAAVTCDRVHGGAPPKAYVLCPTGRTDIAERWQGRRTSARRWAPPPLLKGRINIPSQLFVITPRVTRIERQAEGDDEVRGNVPPELVALFERAKRSIKALPRMSRTESFLKYAEEHPG